MMTRHIHTVDRVLLGLIFAGSAIMGLAMSDGPIPGNEAAQAYVRVLGDSGLFIVIKALELLCGLALIAGLFVPLALAVLAPILFNIVFFHAVLDQAGLPFAVVLMVLWAAVVVPNRDAFVAVVRARPRSH